MPDDIIQRIKNAAHEVAEGYLLFGSSMNDAISKKANDGEIDNAEMLKRICEHANQNVYLSKFQDADSRRNITFDIAEFNVIKKNIDESEKSMELYAKPPEDFRSSLQMVVDAIVDENNAEEKTSQMTKEARYTLNEYKQIFVKLAGAMEAVRVRSVNDAESGFNLISHDAKRMVANGESIGDLAKIASRCVKEDGLNPMPVMKAYGIIEKELVDGGFQVNTEFTKISSLKINHASITLRPVKAMSLAIEKIAACGEIISRINEIVETFDKFEREHGSK